MEHMILPINKRFILVQVVKAGLQGGVVVVGVRNEVNDEFIDT
jgi:hypothetical protein